MTIDQCLALTQSYGDLIRHFIMEDGQILQDSGFFHKFNMRIDHLTSKQIEDFFTISTGIYDLLIKLLTETTPDSDESGNTLYEKMVIRKKTVDILEKYWPRIMPKSDNQLVGYPFIIHSNFFFELEELYRTEVGEE